MIFEYEKKCLTGGHFITERILSSNNPSFFFLHYSPLDFRVKNLIMIPKYFFAPNIIEKRRPLSENARRAGWTGCNILIKNVPPEGKITIVKDEIETPTEDVITKVNKTGFIREYRLEARGWILDVLTVSIRYPLISLHLNRCINLKKHWRRSIRTIIILRTKSANNYKYSVIREL